MNTLTIQMLFCVTFLQHIHCVYNHILFVRVHYIGELPISYTICCGGCQGKNRSAWLLRHVTGCFLYGTGRIVPDFIRAINVDSISPAREQDDFVRSAVSV